MKKKVKIILLLSCVLVCIAAGYGLVYYRRIQQYKEAVQAIHIQNVDLTTIPDGEYIGEKDVDIIRAKVKVTVKNHEITAIDFIDYQHERGKKAGSIPEKIIQQQEIKVDAVSGATNSSKVIQKAVENALQPQEDAVN